MPASSSVFAGILDSNGSPVPGPATSSQFIQPLGMVFDSSGNLYVADNNGSYIVKITPSGTLSIVTGDGTNSPPTPGPAASSSIGRPYGLCIDASNSLYFSDSSNHLVCKITSGGTLSIVAGVSGTTGVPTPGTDPSQWFLNEPNGVAMDASGNLYIADSSNSLIEKITPGGTLSIIAGIAGDTSPATPGPATSSTVGTPTGIAVDASGNIYIADNVNVVLLKINSSGTLSVFATETNGNAFSDMKILTVDSARNVYIADSGNTIVSKFTPGGSGSIIAGTYVSPGTTPDGSPSLNLLRSPTCGLVDSTGNLYVTDAGAYVVYKLTQNIPCFLEGSTISCLVEGKETYVPIEHLKPGMLVNTVQSGPKRIAGVGHKQIQNPGTADRTEQRLYKCSVAAYPELKSDLFLTGGHAILVPSITEDQKAKLIAHLGNIFVTDNHYRLTALVDERAEPWASEGTYTVWHLSLEHEDPRMNYGVYANGGLLVETCSMNYLKNRSYMIVLE